LLFGSIPLPFNVILHEHRFDGATFTSIKLRQYPDQIQKRADDDNAKDGNYIRQD